jgi:hypothetical protein
MAANVFIVFAAARAMGAPPARRPTDDGEDTASPHEPSRPVAQPTSTTAHRPTIAYRPR